MAKAVKIILATIVAFVAFVLHDSWRMIYVAKTGAEEGKMAITDDLINCPVVNFEEFNARAFKTPTIEVETIEECLRHGENMNQPLICRLAGVVADNEARIIDAIFADNTTYEMICRDSGDFHYVTMHRKINSTIAEVASNPGPCSAGFIYGDTHQALLQSVMPTMHNKFNPSTVGNDFKELKRDNFLAGTSFASNFENAVISTGSHAAMVTSMAYQLAGTKKWILHDIEESKSDYFYRSSWAMYPTCLSSFLGGMSRPYIATTGPGDILFFPFAWQHMVFSEAGYNVMTNIRKVQKPNVPYLLSRFSLKNMAKILVYEKFFKSALTANPRQGAHEGGRLAVYMCVS